MDNKALAEDAEAANEKVKILEQLDDESEFSDEERDKVDLQSLDSNRRTS